LALKGKHYGKDFGIEFRIGRFHNIYGPYGTWRGGREKAPAAFLRKAICAEKEFEMWGDGKQTRSFCYIDDCVEGILRLFRSDVRIPLNSTCPLTSLHFCTGIYCFPLQLVLTRWLT